MELAIRLLTPADVDAYLSIRAEMLDDSPFAFLASPHDDVASDPDFVRKQLSRTDGANVILGAFAPELVGTVGVLRDRHSKAAHRANVWGMYVTPAHRRHGIARQLLDAAIAHARSLEGVDQLVLGVSAKTPGAQALYEHVGFRAWGTEPRAIGIDGVYADETYMSLALDEG